MSKLQSVMIIDDSEEDQYLSKRTISKYDQGIKVYQAYDGSEALTMLENMEDKPDLIFLDINMPVMNGHEFLAAYAVRELKVKIVVMLTSSEQRKDVDSSMAYSFVKDYFVKPIEVSDLEKLSRL